MWYVSSARKVIRSRPMPFRTVYVPIESSEIRPWLPHVRRTLTVTPGPAQLPGDEGGRERPQVRRKDDGARPKVYLPTNEKLVCGGNVLATTSALTGARGSKTCL